MFFGKDRTEVFKKYQNKWVAFSEDDEVISSGMTFKSAYEKAVRKGFKEPLVTKLPDLKYDYLLA